MKDGSHDHAALTGQHERRRSWIGEYGQAVALKDQIEV